MLLGGCSLGCPCARIRRTTQCAPMASWLYVTDWCTSRLQALRHSQHSAPCSFSHPVFSPVQLLSTQRCVPLGRQHVFGSCTIYNGGRSWCLVAVVDPLRSLHAIRGCIDLLQRSPPSFHPAAPDCHVIYAFGVSLRAFIDRFAKHVMGAKDGSRGVAGPDRSADQGRPF